MVTAPEIAVARAAARAAAPGRAPATASIEAGRIDRRRFGSRLGTAALCGTLLPGVVVESALGGCASRPGGGGAAPPVSPPRSGSAALGRFEAGGPGALAVDTVQPAEAGGDATATGFARTLRDALARDLRAIGVLDDAAPTRLDAVVAVVSTAGRGGGAVDAQVTLTRAGHARLKKRYRVEGPPAAADGTSAPMVIVAVVAALLDEWYDDPEFNLAAKD